MARPNELLLGSDQGELRATAVLAFLDEPPPNESDARRGRQEVAEQIRIRAVRDRHHLERLQLRRVELGDACVDQVPHAAAAGQAAAPAPHLVLTPQYARPDGRSDSRVEQIGQISRGLKILARELDVPVIAISQLSRAVESRNPPVPMLSDLRESGSIEQDADVVMFVYRDEYYNRESERLGEADLIVAKHRNGPIGEITLSFLPKFPKFASLYRDRGALPQPPVEGNGGAP